MGQGNGLSERVFAPASGRYVALGKIGDPTFNSGLMGSGFGAVSYTHLHLSWRFAARPTGYCRGRCRRTSGLGMGIWRILTGSI